MSLSAVCNIIRSRWNSNFSLSSATAYDNAPFEKPTDDTSAWAKFTVLPGTGSQVSLGPTRFHRTPGVLEIQLFTELEKGATPALLLAQEAIELFRGVTVNEVVFRTPYATRVGKNEEGWYQYNVTCPFFYDESESVAVKNLTFFWQHGHWV